VENVSDQPVVLVHGQFRSLTNRAQQTLSSIKAHRGQPFFERFVEPFASDQALLGTSFRLTGAFGGCAVARWDRGVLQRSSGIDEVQLGIGIGYVNKFARTFESRFRFLTRFAIPLVKSGPW